MQDFKRVANLPFCSPSLANICKNCGNLNIRSATTLEVLPLLLLTYTDDSNLDEFLSIAESVKIDDR